MKLRPILVLAACVFPASILQARGDGPLPAFQDVMQQPSGNGGPNSPIYQYGNDAAAGDMGQCGACGGRFWGSAEFLLWWMKGTSLPPLVTTSPPGTSQTQAGVLGQPGTVVLFGNSVVNGGMRPGGRFTLGYWFDDCQHCGVEADFFMLGSLVSRFNASSDGNPILARPFFDPTTGQQSSELIAFPGLSTGSVNASATSTGLLGADALLRCNLCCQCNSRLDVVGGFRYLRIADHVEVTENLVSTSFANFIPPGTTLTVVDRFDTSNNFYGLDVGLRGEYRIGSWVLAGRADVAVGDNHEVLDVNGSTTVSVPGAPPPVTSAGGLLALQSNIGNRVRDRVVVIPEFDLRLGYQITPRLQVFAGYTFIYWGKVLRAGNQIDLNVNPNLLPPVVTPITGPLQPAPKFDQTSLWIQGIDLGLEFRF